MSSINILSTRIDNITLNEAPELIHTFLTDGNPHQIITANPLMLLETGKNNELENVFRDASLIIPESSGIHWAARFLKTPLKEKIPGIDFMAFLLNHAQEKGYSVFFLGAREKVIVKTVENIKQRYPKLKIAGYNNGYFSDNESAVVSKIKNSHADILFAGLNTPFQETWIHKNLKNLNVKIALGVGGSFDVFSENLMRAPLWMRKSGIEWLFRLLQQPWRILRITKLPLFILKVLHQRITSNQ
ncbi:MAG: WecB/TagA/CpsF family glycosyltransferase [Elusimicrobia bacterium]|nr:WecB/TagA/CpsF family glycosyltransferase [Elusimicrobiota bacterium]